jgi:RHS repeat-associated protein
VAAWLLDSDGKTRPYLFHQDQVTSTTAISGHNGGTVQSAKYAAFGQVQAATGSSVNRQRYTGREDDGTGLMYYRARYYDSSVGRFISEDPLGYAAGVNFYAYVGNNPVNANDPLGLDPYTSRYDTWDLAALGAAGTIAQIPAARSVEYGGMLYQNPVRIPEWRTYSYTNMVTQNNRNGVVIDFDSVLKGATIARDVSPRPIHSHPFGVEDSFSPLDLSDAKKLAKDLLNLGYKLPYTEYLYSFGANDVKSQTIDALDIPATITTIGRPELPIRVNSIEGDGGGSASGGFLLYPNKPNNNNARSVYGK